jgi:hypothetical protein
LESRKSLVQGRKKRKTKKEKEKQDGKTLVSLQVVITSVGETSQLLLNKKTISKKFAFFLLYGQFHGRPQTRRKLPNLMIS